MILTGLNVSPGRRVVEAGTGSGSLSTSLAHHLYPSGCLYTFEYHKGRFEEAKADFARLGDYGTVIVPEHRDVINHGFPEHLNQQIDSVFLDLPAPWLAVPHAAKALRAGGRLCCFSPCIEQVLFEFF